MVEISSRRDARASNIAVFTATVMIAHQVAGKATRDGLFLSFFDVSELPKVVVISALLSMLGVLAMSRLLASMGPSKLVPGVYAFSALLFLGEWILFASAPNATSVALYLHMSIFGALLISGFWSVVNERFDPHSAKRTIARIAAAATLGGVIGGVLAERTTDLVGIRPMLLVLGGLHAVCAVGVGAIGSGVIQRGAAEDINVRSGFRVLRTSRYLRGMGLLMVLVAATAALLDYVFKSQAAAAIGTGENLVAFFASFYAVIGVLTFLIQSVLGSRMLRRFGIAGTMLILPFSVIFGGMLTMFAPRLASVAFLRGAEAVFANSFFRAGFELLYTPVKPADKRPTKTIIDVASNRLGDLAGGGILIALLAVVTDPPVAVVVTMALVCATIALLVLARLHKGYVGQLASNLASGAVSLRAGEAQDATTQRILAELSPDAERRMLEQRLAERNKPVSTPQGVISSDSKLVPLVADLVSRDKERIRNALRSPDFDRSLTAHVIAVLDDPELADEARLELRWLVPRIIGQLTDALLDPDTPVVTRQRLPSVMEVHHAPRTISALVEGLEDPAFLVRYACARALRRMLGRADDLQVSRETVFEAVARELEVDQKTWSSRQALRQAAAELTEAEATEHDLSLDHVFCLLALVLDGDAINLSMQAVVSRDRALRGTAIEYLENVLPAPIRHALWERIGIREPVSRQRRSRVELENELRRRREDEAP